MLDTFGYTPICRISKGGVDITDNFADRLISLTIDSRGGAGAGDTCTIVLDDRGWSIASPETDVEGATTLSIALGYKESGLYDQGTFSINEVTYSGMPKGLALTGRSLALGVAKTPIITEHQGQTLGQVVGQIAGVLGVKPAISPSLANQQIPYYNQHESPMHLLQQMERNYNGLAKVSNGHLTFTDRNSSISFSGQFLSGFTLEPPDLAKWSFTEQNRTAFSNVKANYWDKANNVPVWLTSSVAGQDGGPSFLIKRGFCTQQEAQAAADAKMGSMNRGIVTGTLTLTKGNPGIKGGMTPFAVTNCRDGMNGNYVCNVATHTFTKDGGLMTSLSFNSADSGSASNFASLDNGADTGTGQGDPQSTPSGGGIGSDYAASAANGVTP